MKFTKKYSVVALRGPISEGLSGAESALLHQLESHPRGLSRNSILDQNTLNSLITKGYAEYYAPNLVRSLSLAASRTSGSGAFTSIKRALDIIAERVGSTVGVDRSKTRVTFYLTQRPKTRQGRLDWNKEVDRLSTLCGERMASYSPGIIIGRTGNQLELKRRRNG
jgi:hypothetical protein